MTSRPRERRGWRWGIYRVVTGPYFGGARVVVWLGQIPLVMIQPDLASKVMYVTILSIAANVESAITDWIEGWKFVAEEYDDA